MKFFFYQNGDLTVGKLENNYFNGLGLYFNEDGIGKFGFYKHDKKIREHATFYPNGEIKIKHYD